MEEARYIIHSISRLGLHLHLHFGRKTRLVMHLMVWDLGMGVLIGEFFGVGLVI